jgi:hypothetical protein
LRIEHAVGSSELKLDNPHEARPPLRFEIPHEERCGEAWSAICIDEAHIGARHHLEPQCRV